VAGTGADPDECQGSGADNSNDLAGGTARAWEAGPQEDRRLGGIGTDECGQRQETWVSQDQGWADGSAECAVHVDFSSDAIQPIDPGTVSAVIEEGKGEEGSVDRVHAKVSNDLERDDERSSPIQAEGHCLRRTGFPFNGAFALDFQDSCCTLC
jgi:hypothetical protein